MILAIAWETTGLSAVVSAKIDIQFKVTFNSNYCSIETINEERLCPV
jgi:hypothetical protein